MPSGYRCACRAIARKLRTGRRCPPRRDVGCCRTFMRADWTVRPEPLRHERRQELGKNRCPRAVCRRVADGLQPEAPVSKFRSCALWWFVVGLAHEVLRKRGKVVVALD